MPPGVKAWAWHLVELVYHALGEGILGTHHNKVDGIEFAPFDDLRRPAAWQCHVTWLSGTQGLRG